MSWTQKLEHLDRRIIFVVLGLAVMAPIVWPIGFPIQVSKQVRDFHAAIATLPDDATVLLAMDYEPAGKPELYPMNVAILKQLFGTKKNVKVVGLELFNAGPPLAEKVLKEVARDEFHKTYGVDFVNLGYKEGREIVMANMGKSIHQVFPADFKGTPLSELPIMAGVRNYADIDMLISVSIGYPGTKEWVQQVQSVYNLPMVSATTAVSAPEYFPYYQSGQLLGLLDGLAGAAQYEQLLGFSGIATRGMDAQSTGHWTIIAFILWGNVLYYLNRRRRREA